MITKLFPPDEHLYFISERTFLTMLDTSHLIKLELVNDQIRNPEKTINSAHRRLQTKENEITSKRTMLAINTIKLEKLHTKQHGRQDTSQLKYDKTDGLVWLDGQSFINVYLFVQKFTQNCTRRKWNKPENTRDITGCMGEIIQNWEPYLGTYKSFKNTKTADIYIALHNTCNSNPDTGWFWRKQKQMDYWTRNYMVMRIQDTLDKF